MIETVYALLVGLFFAVAVYLILSKSVIRMLLGITILGNAVNLLIFTAGRLTREVPPIIAGDANQLTQPFANPLPQALILTAIVIGFGVQAFALVLFKRTYQSTNTDDLDGIKSTEQSGKASLPKPS